MFRFVLYIETKDYKPKFYYQEEALVEYQSQSNNL